MAELQGNTTPLYRVSRSSTCSFMGGPIGSLRRLNTLRDCLSSGLTLQRDVSRVSVVLESSSAQRLGVWLGPTINRTSQWVDRSNEAR